MSKDFDFKTLPAIKVIPFDELKVRLHSELRLCGVYAICVKGGDTSKGMVYIGSAVWFQRRFIGHRSNLNKGCHHAQILQNIYSVHGGDAFEVRLIELLTKSEEETLSDFRKRIFEREQFWIDSVPRLCLINATPTAGSQAGRVRTEEQNAKVKQSLKTFYKNNPEARAQISSRSKKLWEDPEHREHMRKATIENWQDQSIRESRSLGLRRTAATPEDKQRRSLAAKKAMSSDEARLRSSRVSLSNWQREEYRQIISAARRATWRDPVHRTLHCKALKNFYINNPEAIEAKRISGRKNWENPELRERMTDAIKERMSKPEEKEKKSKLFKSLWADDDFRKETSQSILKGHCSKSDALIFISPDGQTYVTDNATAFAEKFKLEQTSLSSVARGTQKKHKGWTGYTSNSWKSVPNYAIRVLTGDHPDLPEYQELSALEQIEIQRKTIQEKQLKLDRQSQESLCSRLKTLGSKSSPAIYISPSGEKYVSDVPAQFATAMGFEIEGQRHKFSLIIRTDKSYKGWTGYKLESWSEVPNDAIRVLWGDHPDLPKQELKSQVITPIQLRLNL